jgi:putative restriction endonuclease
VRLFVAVTDYDWFQVHAAQSSVEEVNFWQPSPDSVFRALSPGEPLLFKLHSPRNFIAGGGFFAKFVQLPLSIAWEAFGVGNGVQSLDEGRKRISKYRQVPIGPYEDPNIGCIVLAEPFFFPQDLWIPAPSDFSLNIVRGKGYDSEVSAGETLWRDVVERLARCSVYSDDDSAETKAIIEASRFGKPVTVLPRLGQGAFRVLVTDAYEKRCAFTRERTLPVLEAAHIKPYACGGKHELSNGVLLRSDLHKLFDLGYITVDPATRQIVVSRRIREEFENGQDYYALHGTILQRPIDPVAFPSVANLTFHSESIFRE